MSSVLFSPEHWNQSHASLAQTEHHLFLQPSHMAFIVKRGLNDHLYKMLLSSHVEYVKPLGKWPFFIRLIMPKKNVQSLWLKTAVWWGNMILGTARRSRALLQFVSMASTVVHYGTVAVFVPKFMMLSLQNGFIVSVIPSWPGKKGKGANEVPRSDWTHQMLLVCCCPDGTESSLQICGRSLMPFCLSWACEGFPPFCRGSKKIWRILKVPYARRKHVLQLHIPKYLIWLIDLLASTALYVLLRWLLSMHFRQRSSGSILSVYYLLTPEEQNKNPTGT